MYADQAHRGENVPFENSAKHNGIQSRNYRWFPRSSRYLNLHGPVKVDSIRVRLPFLMCTLNFLSSENAIWQLVKDKDSPYKVSFLLMFRINLIRHINQTGGRRLCSGSGNKSIYLFHVSCLSVRAMRVGAARKNMFYKNYSKLWI